jgi:hypothetical protein
MSIKVIAQQRLKAVTNSMSSKENTMTSKGKLCCLFFPGLPDGCICSILQFYSAKLSVKCLAQFSSMNSRLYHAIFSNSLRSFWSSLPPVCLCTIQQCFQCGREKVPKAYYKLLLSKSGSLCGKLNIHFELTQMSSISSADYLTDEVGALLGSSKESISDLVLNIAISAHSERDESLNCTLSSNDIKSGSELCSLYIDIGYRRNDKGLYEDSIIQNLSLSMLKIFGLKLQQLSILVSSQPQPSNIDTDAFQIWSCDQIENDTTSSSTLCPLLTKLELFGCNPRMFCGHASTIVTPLYRFLSTDINQQQHVGNMSTTIPNNHICSLEFESIGFPRLTIVEVEENFKSLDVILNILRFVPVTIIHILIMGNTSKYLQDILGFFSIFPILNLKNLGVLEIHDSSPWPFCERTDQVDAYAVSNVFLACSNLKKIVMSTVEVTDVTLCSLFRESLTVTHNLENYSTIISRN